MQERRTLQVEHGRSLLDQVLEAAQCGEHLFEVVEQLRWAVRHVGSS
jgi:hypothetical protein